MDTGRNREKLRAQLGAEALRERADDLAAQLRRILVRERPLGRLERDREGDRLLARADLLAAVLAHEAHVTHLRDGLPGRLDELASRHRLVDGASETLSHCRV